MRARAVSGGIEQMGNILDRVTVLREGAKATGFTIDYLDALSRGLSIQALRKLIGNASEMPSYMKSSDNPYVRRSARPAPSDTC